MVQPKTTGNCHNNKSNIYDTNEFKPKKLDQHRNLTDIFKKKNAATSSLVNHKREMVSVNEDVEMQIDTPVDQMRNICEDSMDNSEDSINDSDNNSHERES